MEPNTRRVIVIMLAVIAIATIVAEVVLRLDGSSGDAMLLGIATTCVGAIAGLAVPHVPAADSTPVQPLRREATPAEWVDEQLE